MQPCLLYVGTADGIFVFHFDGGLRLVGRGLEGNAVRGIAIHPQDPATAHIACGLHGWGLHYTRDAGQRFETIGFTDRWVWEAAFHPLHPEVIYVGVEPPMLFVSTDDGQHFTAFQPIEQLPSRPNWTFFHPPFYAGHIHGLAIHPERPERIFAGVEHGALIYSHDGGRTWREALAGHDLHRIVIDPLNPDRILAGAGEGLFVSHDAGISWHPIDELIGKYVHAICFDPRNPATIYVYVYQADGSPLYRSDDGGQHWQAIGEGLPGARSADSLRPHPAQPDVVFYGGDVAQGRSQLFISINRGEHWTPLSEELPKIWRLQTASQRTATQTTPPPAR
ncbi:MAG: hypothetical protein RMJ48_02260 [Roseiflexaceae bacterium]|nr:hypothetical protein [Roseiflexaceae bacterium]